MEKSKKIIAITGVFIFLFSYGKMSGNINPDPQDSKPAKTQTKSTQTTKKTTQTKSKSAQTKPKTTSKSVTSEPVNKPKDTEAIMIGTQSWAIANLIVSTFRNGDSIPEVKTDKEWVKAGESGKPAWCYYNNDPKMGLKYGKLYNWYAVNDLRELAPEGWIIPSDDDWAQLSRSLGGQPVAGGKMKTTSGWSEGAHGTNESGFTGLPGGYRIENGIFLNLGSIGTWWSITESKTFEAYDHFLSLSGSLGRSSTPKLRGESVRCLRK